jgi:hypothetical protein
MRFRSPLKQSGRAPLATQELKSKPPEPWLRRESPRRRCGARPKGERFRSATPSRKHAHCTVSDVRLQKTRKVERILERLFVDSEWVRVARGNKCRNQRRGDPPGGVPPLMRA